MSEIPDERREAFAREEARDEQEKCRRRPDQELDSGLRWRRWWHLADAGTEGDALNHDADADPDDEPRERDDGDTHARDYAAADRNRFRRQNDPGDRSRRPRPGVSR